MAPRIIGGGLMLLAGFYHRCALFNRKMDHPKFPEDHRKTN